MPVVPPQPTTSLPSLVFWSAEDVLNFARVLINDAQGGLAGQELADSNPYTWVLLNLAYAKLQNALEDTNVEAVTSAEAVVGPLTAAPAIASDPSTQVRLGFDGYWDGTNDTNPDVILPGDLLQPLEIWERPSGSMQPFVPMKQWLDVLPSRWWMTVGGGRLGLWRFRNDQGTPAIFFPGSQINNEIKISYVPSLPLLQMGADALGNPIFPQVPLARAGEALAYGIAAEWAEIRGAANAMVLRGKYDDQVRIISNKSAKRANATTTRMRGYNFGRSRRGWY